MAQKHVIAVDLGAESGRVMRVSLDGAAFALEEVHRFRNVPIKLDETLYWNVLRLWYDIQIGLAKALAGGATAGQEISSIGVCTWGVDYALLDGRGNVIDNPVHYRDARTKGMPEWVFEQVPRRTVFERTGIQVMNLNTLYQLASLKASHSPQLDLAETLLMLPSLFTYWMTGAKVNEFTHVTTTQCYNPRTAKWDSETLDTLGIPTKMLGEVVPAGTQVGTYKGVPVIVPATHDTGSAVVATPTTTKNYAYLSSGTWSLIGLEVPAPIINDAAFAAAITNEGGAYGTFRLLQNVMGLWLAQESRATWAASGKTYSYDELVVLAEKAPPFRSLVDPNDSRFLDPGDMPQRIRDFCRETGQPIPETEGAIMRTIFESLALKYRAVLDKLVALTGSTVDVLHIIGGGSQNRLLNQMTANAINRPVVAGPVEASTLGNAIVQFISLGELADIWQARDLLSHSVGMRRYEPQNAAVYEEQYARFKQIADRS